MASYILIVVFSIALLACYLSITGGDKTKFNLIIRLVLCLLALHSLQTWIVDVYFPDYRQFNYYMPYGLLYGPFLYFGYLAAGDKTIRRRQVIIHGLPFACFFLGFIWMIVFPRIFQTYQPLYTSVFYGVLLLSMLGYMIWLLLFNGGWDIKRERRLLISQVTVILAFTATVLAVWTFTGFTVSRPYSDRDGSLIFLAMLCVALALFFYIARQLVRKIGQDQADLTTVRVPVRQPLKQEQSETTSRYQKSAINPRLLAEYTARMTELMNTHRVFLDEGLTLESLAHRLKIPRHHLSQVFSLKMGKNFNTYINEHRINYVVGLMQTVDDLSITEIMHRSGFASKASFNRYFKQFQGCTPSEYRARIRYAK